MEFMPCVNGNCKGYPECIAHHSDPQKNKKVTTRSAAKVTAKVTAQKKVVQIGDAVNQFPKEKFVKMDVAGDGHCIINSIIKKNRKEKQVW